VSRTDATPAILDLAKELGVSASTPTDGILDYCRHRIDRWVAEAGGVTNIEVLESLVSQRLQMVFEEIRTGDDFDRLKDVYARGKKDFVFAAMRTKFDDGDNPTYGALIQRRNVAADAPDRFVAVIDCRGKKLARRFFTRWHEIAHRLTTHADGGETEPGYRSEHDPIERLMDDIAGHIGFYEPLFAPAFHQANGGNLLLKFDTVESVQRSRFPAASFQSTLFACIRRMQTPVIYLEAALAHKKDVKREIEDDSPRLFAAPPPPPGELRAVKINPNKAAQQQKFTIPANMRVPAGSVIDRLFETETIADATGLENLSHWESRGKSLERRAVVVEARKVPDRVIAIVQPVLREQAINQHLPPALFPK
jgi:hypothetical protein